MRILDYLFACRHTLGQPVTIQNESYRRCITCGAAFSFDLSTWETGREIELEHERDCVLPGMQVAAGQFGLQMRDLCEDDAGGEVDVEFMSRMLTPDWNLPLDEEIVRVGILELCRGVLDE